MFKAISKNIGKQSTISKSFAKKQKTPVTYNKPKTSKDTPDAGDSKINNTEGGRNMFSYMVKNPKTTLAIAAGVAVTGITGASIATSKSEIDDKGYADFIKQEEEKQGEGDGEGEGDMKDYQKKGVEYSSNNASNIRVYLSISIIIAILLCIYYIYKTFFSRV